MTTQTCTASDQSFQIPEKDKAFYENLGISLPTLCPDERCRRRLAHRNERSLYRRKCDATGKVIISAYHQDANIKAYEAEYWWSDKWNALDYGKEFDFSRPFFEQYAELQAEVPQLALAVWNSEGSQYCNYIGNVKNSYLLFGSVYSEDCLYGSPYYSKNCVDNLTLRECEWCYECVDCRKLYECFHCQDCHGSSNLIYCYDLQGCDECIGCAGLRQKKYHIFNKPYKQEEYFEMKKKLDLNDPAQKKHISEQLDAIKLLVPHRCIRSNKVEEVSGNYIYESKNIDNCYYTDRSQDCRHCAQVVDMKDCYDNNFTEENEQCCEYLGSYQNSFLSFSKFCNQVSDGWYCDSCFTSKNLFGCICLRNAEYCILNKQYTKEEYEALVPRIIEHMKKTGEWSEFFPISLSAFGYNETVAHEYFPLTKEEAQAKGYKWRDEEVVSKYISEDTQVPPHITQVGDDICDQILTCEESGKYYKIQKAELDFYRKMNLPIPRLHPDVRHGKRMAMRNPRHLWNKKCDQCQKDIPTTYSTERKEKVLCEECYLNAIN